jgi:hypothetical protein
MGFCAFLLLIRLHWINSRQKVERQVSGDYIMAGGDLVSSPLAAALDPRVDVESVQEQMLSPLDEVDEDPFEEESDDDEDDDKVLNEASIDAPVTGQAKTKDE